ncbi:MAG: radical SAM protein [Dehalococcoidia bacterium]
MPASGWRATIACMPTHPIPDGLNRSFELGPVRPPSEARSLLIRATRNCPWNRCQFCPIYKGTRFELRTVPEVVADIESAKAIADGIKETAWRTGYGNRVRELAAQLCRDPRYGHCVNHVAFWLSTGSSSAFLQDSNSLLMRTADMVQVITFLRKTFPELHRVTTYGRSHTAARKALTELEELRNAGLDRVHIGLETGYDALLTYMEKGCTAGDHIKGGRRVREAGISLCEYVMPGLGGRRMSREHALETARVLNEIDPDHIRLRSLHVSPAMSLWTRMETGDFEMQTEDEVVREIAVFIENLDVTSHFKSDHTLNLLMEVQGKLPEDKEKCLGIIDRYLSLPEDERFNFQLGRRAGYYTTLADLADTEKHGLVDHAVRHIRQEGMSVEHALLRLKNTVI